MLALRLSLEVFALLFVCCNGKARRLPSNCWKKGGCGNLLVKRFPGNQDRPVLEGPQIHANSDGTCTYGHAAKEGQCNAGFNCGYTWFDCECIDKDRAQEGAQSSKTLKIIGGIAIIVVGFGCVGACCAAERFSVGTPSSAGSSKVFPVNGTFSDPFGPPPSTAVVGKAPTQTPMELSTCTVVMAGVLGAVTLMGGIIIFIGVTEDSTAYFNQCDAAG
eukprot:gnl/TRDRNA2_/TRDRNA2_193066_c0_seq1.p1 gnl/TRDRNA2_/TRDRNA2_193066_c0~~gnl/TRDRNA2_/TRDRNA2_193066_c0_seq1.p1  ORF type:complete len:233 (+),score=23.45 gnl/TRDRNA2_/TRDRNA2_193066_c0_seq1:46-699(+)